jgi:hypothetical protein
MVNPGCVVESHGQVLIVHRRQAVFVEPLPYTQAQDEVLLVLIVLSVLVVLVVVGLVLVLVVVSCVWRGTSATTATIIATAAATVVAATDAKRLCQ